MVVSLVVPHEFAAANAHELELLDKELHHRMLDLKLFEEEDALLQAVVVIQMPCVLFDDLEVLQDPLHYLKQGQRLVALEEFKATLRSLQPKLFVKRIVIDDVVELFSLNLESHEWDTRVLEGIVHVGEHVRSVEHHTYVAEVGALLKQAILVESEAVHNVYLATLYEMNVRRVVV